MDRGLLDAAEFNNAVLRPPARLPRRLQGLHAAELPPVLGDLRDHVQQAEVRRAAGEHEIDHRLRREAASADMSWKAIDRYSKDYIEMQTRSRGQVLQDAGRDPAAQLDSWDKIIAAKKRREPAVQEISIRSALSPSARCRWERHHVDYRMAYNHFFGAKKARRQEGQEGLIRSSRRPAGRRVAVFFGGGPAHANAERLLLTIDRISTAGRPGLFLADRLAHRADFLGGVLALCA
jgi:hypothetical protein